MVPEPPTKKRSLLRGKPSKPAVAVLLLLLIGVVVFRDRIAATAALKGILDAHAPDAALLRRVAAQQRNPRHFLEQIWRSGKIPHRWEVVSYINHAAVSRREVVSQTRSLLAAASRDRDLTVRITALNLARIAGQDVWQPAAMDDLDDPDDDLRLEALHTLHRGHATNAIPVILTRLDDPSPAVAEFAGGVIHNFTGLDTALLTTNPAVVADWWNRHGGRLPKIPDVELLEPPPGPDFSDLVFEQADGRPLPVAALRGKPVHLFYFATWSGECTLQMPALRALHTRLGDQVHLIGIGIDPLATANQKHGAAVDPGRARKHVLRMAALQRVSFPVVFDPKGTAVLRLEGSEIPLHVLLDADLRMVRRFSGRRTAPNLEQIIRRLAPVTGP